MKSRIRTKHAKPPDFVGVDHTGAFIVRGVGGGPPPEVKFVDPAIEAATVEIKPPRFRWPTLPKIPKVRIVWSSVIVAVVSGLAWISFAVALIIALKSLDETLR